jgi:multidrug efflux pump subunit AcrA (membrane-fusion protein)
MNLPSVPATGPAFDAWDVIDQWIDELTRLAREPMSSPAFQGELLRRLSEAVAAKRAAVWQRTPEWSVVKTTGGDSEQTASAAWSPQVVAERARVVAQVAERGEPCLLPPRSHSDDDDGLPNPTDGVLLICPWLIDGTPRGALEVELRGATSPEARQGALRLLTTFAQLMADHEINRERLSWKERAEAADELDALLTAIYADADPQAAAYALANEGRRWGGCDRVSVLRFDGKRTRVAAVSGVDAVDRRAGGIAKLERLGTAVAASRTDLSSNDRSESRLPSVERALADYVEAAESREIVALLLREPRSATEETESDDRAEKHEDQVRIVGLLVFERFTGAPLDVAARARFEILRRHGSAAISHAADIESIPLGRFWHRFAKHRSERRRRWTKIGICLAAAIAAAAIPFFITVPYTVEARGTLEPREQWDLFAPTSGIVAEVQAEHGQQVKPGALLVRLRKPELEVERVRLLGEIQTADRRLAALATNRATPGAADAAAVRSQQLLVAEEEQLKVRVESLRTELSRLDEQVRELTIVAPADGSVTTWDAKRLLSDKPVDRGHPLLSLANLNRPWVLELRVPDRRLADIAAARSESGNELEVEFIVAADPQTKLAGTLERLSDAAQTDARSGTTVAAVVRIGDGLTRDDAIRAELRKPGTSVIAKIHCGTRSLGSIWTEDFIYYLRTRWFF